MGPKVGAATARPVGSGGASCGARAEGALSPLVETSVDLSVPLLSSVMTPPMPPSLQPPQLDGRPKVEMHEDASGLSSGQPQRRRSPTGG